MLLLNPEWTAESPEKLLNTTVLSNTPRQTVIFNGKNVGVFLNSHMTFMLARIGKDHITLRQYTFGSN